MSTHTFVIGSTWDGRRLRPDEWARIELTLGEEIVVRVEAAHHGDPVPPAPPGRTPGLWDFEVVELFLLGRDEHYLEIELGPQGHWLGLRLAGCRQVEDDSVPIAFRARCMEERWTGEARLARSWLPEGLWAANAYALHGAGSSRRFLAMHPVPGDFPDFHRLEYFGPLPST